ncbi:hypothetical protein NL676_014275 [Syzygium grande]|nr:hypothetical protein NL676_014275 [Syzygium grande]
MENPCSKVTAQARQKGEAHQLYGNDQSQLSEGVEKRGSHSRIGRCSVTVDKEDGVDTGEEFRVRIDTVEEDEVGFEVDCVGKPMR